MMSEITFPKSFEIVLENGFIIFENGFINNLKVRK